jgi:hypothetical protein
MLRLENHLTSAYCSSLYHNFVNDFRDLPSLEVLFFLVSLLRTNHQHGL